MTFWVISLYIQIVVYTRMWKQEEGLYNGKGQIDFKWGNSAEKEGVDNEVSGGDLELPPDSGI